MSHAALKGSSEEVSRIGEVRDPPTPDEVLVAKLRYFDTVEHVKQSGPDAIANAERRKFVYHAILSEYERDARSKETAAAHAMATSNETLSRRQLWVAAAVGACALVQAVMIVWDHFDSTPPVVYCADGKRDLGE